MRLIRNLCTLVGAGALLAVLVGVASAGRLSTSNQSLTAGFTRINFAGGFGTVECEASVEGSFHGRTIAKTVGSLTGVITAANVARCSRGGATVLRETLPWHIQYEGFAGALPNITSVRAHIIGVAFRIREPTFGVTCLGASTAEQPAMITFNREAGGTVTSATIGGRDTTTCGGEGTFTGTSSSISSLRITLI